MSLMPRKKKKYDETKILDFASSLAEKTTKILVASSSLTLIIGFIYLWAFCYCEKIRISFATTLAISILVELGGVFVVVLGLSFLPLLKPLLYIELLPMRVFLAFQAKNWRTRFSIITFFLLTQFSFLFIANLALLAFSNERIYKYYFYLISIILMYYFFQKLVLSKLKIKHASGWILAYNLQVLLIFILILAISFFSIKSYTALIIFALIFFILQNGLISIYSEALLKRNKIWMIRAFLSMFLIFCMLLANLQPKLILVNPVLNFVAADWKNPKQFYITKEQTQFLYKDFWHKEDEKNITIPLCILFDDGLTVYARTLSGINVELIKKETSIKYTESYLTKKKDNSSCEKVI